MQRKRSTCSEYFDSSNIHGFRYLSDKDRSWGERLWWLVMILAAIYGCIRLISNVYDKWQTSPVIISIAETATPISEIPFPSVIICPLTKAKKRIFNLTDVLDRMVSGNLMVDDLPEFEQQSMAAMSQLCEPYIYHRLRSKKNLDCSNCVELMKELMPRREDLIIDCYFRLDSSCFGEFTEIMTEEGVCYSFNGHDLISVYREGDNVTGHSDPSKLWTLEGGYKPDAPLDAYPYRGLSSGTAFGLFITVRTADEDFDPFCKGPTPGFTVVLDTPHNIPSTAMNSIPVSLNQEITIKLKPKSIITLPNLKKYPARVRQCFFTNERYLRFFIIYSQRNCEVECLTNATLSKCGCVRFYMPTLPGTRICGMNDRNCTMSVRFDQVLQNAKKICNCMPACTSLAYDLEIFQTTYEAAKYGWSLGAKPNDGFSYSSIKIYFSEEQFVPFKRSELYGFIDFVANCGGLLGLFLGVSIISIVEIFYFTTLRLLCKLRKRRQPVKPIFTFHIWNMGKYWFGAEKN